ncbi:MAG: hypothetical protein AAF383_08700 [Cyanobacteria bacterium P01_A01_bin.83]
MVIIYDLVARYGGEEFVVLVRANLDKTFDLARRIPQRFELISIMSDRRSSNL